MYVYVPIKREIPTKAGDEVIYPQYEPLNRHLERARLHDICGHQSTASAVSPATVARPGPRILALAPLRHQSLLHSHGWLLGYPG